MQKIWGNVGMEFLLTEEEYALICDVRVADEVKGEIQFRQSYSSRKRHCDRTKLFS